MTIIVLDVDNLCYRNWYALSGGGLYTKPVVVGLLRDLRTFAQMFQSNQFVFCFDGDNLIRSRIYPAYKAQREQTKEKTEIREQRDLLRLKILPAIGYKHILWHDQAEADDHIARVVTGPHKYVIVSGDNDLYQCLVPHKVVIHQPVLKTTILADDMEERYGLPPSQWVWYKALMGCSTDNIKGVKGFGKITALKWIKGTLKPGALFNRANTAESMNLVSQNMNLIRLPHKDLALGKFVHWPDEIDPERWNSVMEQFDVEFLCGKYPMGGSGCGLTYSVGDR